MMKPRTLLTIAALGVLGLLTVVSTAASAADWSAGMSEGKPAFKSMGPLTFGPDGVLFVADTRSAAVVAVATGDTSNPAGPAKGLKVEGVDQKIAALLGTAAEQITLNDMAVNPTSQNIYLAVSRGRGPDSIPVL